MGIKEKKVTIKGKVSIGTTVSYPDDSRKYPAIVLIMGTGKTDRDRNEKGFKSDLYKNFAEKFLDFGLVSVRYDKRGTYQTQGDFNTAGLNDLVDDAVSVIRYTRPLPYVDEARVIVCGHSEGAMIATLLSAKEDTEGLLLLGGAATCMKDALLYQNYLAAEEFAKKKRLPGMLLRSQTSQEKTNAKVDAMFRKCISAKKDKPFFGGTADSQGNREKIHIWLNSLKAVENIGEKNEGNYKKVFAVYGGIAPDMIIGGLFMGSYSFDSLSFGDAFADQEIFAMP